MTRTFAAAALLLAASAGATFATDGGSTMLGIAAERESREVGVSIDADMLTLNQIAVINAITTSSGYGPNEKAHQIRAILGH